MDSGVFAQYYWVMLLSLGYIFCFRICRPKNDLKKEELNAKEVSDVS